MDYKNKILIIDDDINCLEYFDTIISANISNLEIITEKNPNRALIRTIEQKEEYSVILIDLKMPIISGIDIAKKLREEKITTPILFISGHYLNDEIMNEMEKIGFFDFFHKTSDKIEIRLFINKINTFINACKNCKTRKSESEINYKYIFDNAPIAIVEEDISEMKKLIDDIKREIGDKSIIEHIEHNKEIADLLVKHIKIKRINAEAEAIFKIKSTDDLKKIIFNLSDENNFNSFKERIYAISNKEKKFHRILNFKNSSGKNISCEISINFPDNDEGWSNVIATVIDITEVSYLENKANYLYSSISKSPVVVFKLEYVPNWTVNFISDNISLITGYSSRDIISGRISWLSLFCQDDVPRLEEEISDNIKQDKEEFTIQCRISTLHRELKWVKLILSRERDKFGKFVAINGIIIDISSETSLHEKLASSFTKLKMMIESTKTAYLILDGNGNIIEVNEQMLEMLSCNDSSIIIGKSPKMFICEKEYPKYDSSLKSLLNGDNVENLELCINENNLFSCNTSWIRVNAGLMENGERKIFCLINDITKAKNEEMKKYIDEQKKRDKVKQTIIRLRNTKNIPIKDKSC